MSLVKGIKKGKTIELLEEINVPDGEEILIDIQTVSNFWTSLEIFRNSQEFNNFDNDAEILTDLRDKTKGRNVEIMLGYGESPNTELSEQVIK